MSSRYQLPDVPISRIVAATVAVSAVVALFYLLIRFHRTLLLLFAAVILSIAVRPVVRWLEERGLSRPVALFAVFGAVAVALGALVWFTAPMLAEQSSMIVASLEEGYVWLRSALTDLPNILVQRAVVMLPESLTEIGEMVSQVGGETAAAGTPVVEESQVQRMLFGVTQVIAIIMLAVGWTLEGDYVKQAALLLVPARQRVAARELVNALEAKISGFVLGQGILSLSVGALALVAFLIIGLPNALLLAIFAGIMEAIPYAGPFLGAAPALIVALSISPTTALWVALAMVIIQQLENNLLVPRVMDRTIGVRPLLGLLSVVAMTSLFGILGALVSLPTAAIVQTVMDRLISSREQRESAATNRDRLGVLHYHTTQLVHDVQAHTRRKYQQPSAETDVVEDELEAIVLSLESYLTDAREH